MKIWKAGAAAAAGAAGAALLCSEYEKRQLTFGRYEVVSRRLPRAFDGLRLAVLADLHGRRFGADNEELYTYVAAAHPDLIVCAGDMVLKSRPDVTAAVARFLGRLTEICPVYAGNGNHEMELRRIQMGGQDAGSLYAQALRREGVTVLEDDTVTLERDGAKIDLSGLDLDLAFYAKGLHAPMRSGYIRRKLGPAKSGRYHILIGHYPNYFPQYEAWGADLVLAGHMHGGTIRLPGIGGLMSPNFEFFPEYDKGLYRRGDAAMVVSGGLGTHSVNIRLGHNFPEIPIIILRRP